MSFYSYKNANSECSPGQVRGNVLNGLNQRVCIQVKNVYDSCMSQEQLDDRTITLSDIVPVLPGDCRPGGRPCNCSCDGNACTCACPPLSQAITHEEAVENAENAAGPLPRPQGAWTFESCRSSTTRGNISNLSIERLSDRPQFARVRCTVDAPIDVLFVDQRCQEWMGRARIPVEKDVLLCIPDDSIVPFTLESLVSAICVSGTYIGSCQFQITVCITVVLKILAEVDILVPTYGFCEVPPCEAFSEAVCDTFFSLPLFPQSSCAFEQIGGANGNGNGNGNGCPGVGGANGQTSTCSSCGMTCASNCSICPRCGRPMTSAN